MTTCARTCVYTQYRYMYVFIRMRRAILTWVSDCCREQLSDVLTPEDRQAMIDKVLFVLHWWIVGLVISGSLHHHADLLTWFVSL